MPQGCVFFLACIVWILIHVEPTYTLRMFLVNSPIVRAENLRFREEGVREVVSRVLLPWLNSFRFFLGQATLYKKEQRAEFQYDPHAKKSENVMDCWILARCQSLIKLVREEMAGACPLRVWRWLADNLFFPF